MASDYVILYTQCIVERRGISQISGFRSGQRRLRYRMKKILKRTGKNEKEIKDLGGIQIDKEGRTVSVDGKPIELSLREYELLLYLVQNENIALSRDKILNNVWNYDYFGDARTIDTHVKKLRSKLGVKGDMIKTIWGMGYKLSLIHI